MDSDCDPFALARANMVEHQLRDRGISDAAVLKAMGRVPRHLFAPERLRGEAYEDHPLPLGPDQTISQPYIIGLMLESLRLTGAVRVLEIGTGSGYQTALLAEICEEVFSVEIDPALSEKARQVLEDLNYRDVQLRVGDGLEGWPEFAPFDAIVVAAAVQEIPRNLVKQLAEGGRMVFPIGDESQVLEYLERTPDGLISQDLGMVRFVPMKAGQ